MQRAVHFPCGSMHFAGQSVNREVQRVLQDHLPAQGAAQALHAFLQRLTQLRQDL